MESKVDYTYLPCVMPRSEEKHFKTIGLEEHFQTPLYNKMIQALNTEMSGWYGYLQRRNKELRHDVEKQLDDLENDRLAYMDAAGVDMEVLSLNNPGTQAFDPKDAIPLAKDANQVVYDTIQRHPDRFRGFAAIPTSDPRAAAEELERCVTKLGFKGTLINGSTQYEYMDDKKFWEIFEAAESLNVPVYLHPTNLLPKGVSDAYFKGFEGLSKSAWGFGMDTLTHVLRLIFSGVFDKFPNLKLLVGHYGEGLPFFIQRIDEHANSYGKTKGLKKSPSEYIRDNIYVTTSGNWYQPAFICTMLALGVDKILFATDWPYESNTSATEFLNNLQISDDDKEKISHLNAEKLLNI
jgi:2,3-dihydroxybenzoate decarboxylase